MHYTLQQFREDPTLLKQFTHRDPVRCLCGRCGAAHTKSKRAVRLAVANEGQKHFFCTRSCSSLRQRDGTWDERDGVVGRVCKTCKQWTPKTRLHLHRGWLCNTCMGRKPRSRWNMYRRRARDADIPFTLTYKQFMAHWQKPCTYCGSEIETIGLDRYDNTKGYKDGNVVPCCPSCNWMKGDGSVEDFLARCARVAERHG